MVKGVLNTIKLVSYCIVIFALLNLIVTTNIEQFDPVYINLKSNPTNVNSFKVLKDKNGDGITLMGIEGHANLTGDASDYNETEIKELMYGYAEAGFDSIIMEGNQRLDNHTYNTWYIKYAHEKGMDIGFEMEKLVNLTTVYTHKPVYINETHVSSVKPSSSP